MYDLVPGTEYALSGGKSGFPIRYDYVYVTSPNKEFMRRESREHYEQKYPGFRLFNALLPYPMDCYVNESGAGVGFFIYSVQEPDGGFAAYVPGIQVGDMDTFYKSRDSEEEAIWGVVRLYLANDIIKIENQGATFLS